MKYLMSAIELIFALMIASSSMVLSNKEPWSPPCSQQYPCSLKYLPWFLPRDIMPYCKGNKLQCCNKTTENSRTVIDGFNASGRCVCVPLKHEILDMGIVLERYPGKGLPVQTPTGVLTFAMPAGVLTLAMPAGVLTFVMPAGVLTFVMPAGLCPNGPNPIRPNAIPFDRKTRTLADLGFGPMGPKKPRTSPGLGFGPLGQESLLKYTRWN